MRPPSEVLTRARAHLAGGWSEPLSLTAAGIICTAEDEGLAKYCVHDALRVAGGGVDSMRNAEDFVQRLLQLQGVHVSLNEWAAEPGRTLEQVLVLFAKAAARAAVVESR